MGEISRLLGLWEGRRLIDGQQGSCRSRWRRPLSPLGRGLLRGGKGRGRGPGRWIRGIIGGADEMREVEQGAGSADPVGSAVVGPGGVHRRLERPQPHARSIARWVADLGRELTPRPLPHPSVVPSPAGGRHRRRSGGIGAGSRWGRGSPSEAGGVREGAEDEHVVGVV